MSPPSPELLETRQFLVYAGVAVSAISLSGGIAAYIWMRSQRVDPLGPESALGRLIDRIRSAGSRAPTARHDAGGRLGIFFACLVLLTFLNLLVFLITTLWIGGDASAGNVVAGRFYVSSHGHLTEVSEGIYTFNLWHARSVWISTLAMFVCGAALRFVERRGKASRRLP